MLLFIFVNAVNKKESGFFCQFNSSLFPWKLSFYPRVKIADLLEIGVNIPGGFYVGTDPNHLVAIIQVGHDDRHFGL